MKTVAAVLTIVAFTAVTATAQTGKKSPAVVPSVSPQVLAAIKAAATKKLLDPYSAQFERMNRATRPNAKGEMHDVVCGFVNAKNAYGGYVGARPFIFFVSDTSFYTQRPGDGADAIIFPVLMKMCEGLI